MKDKRRSHKVGFNQASILPKTNNNKKPGCLNVPFWHFACLYIFINIFCMFFQDIKVSQSYCFLSMSKPKDLVDPN